jgi:nucleotide-binding universal stress UspA family protein
MGTIVVGVDGSESSKTALRWAVEEARYRDANLRVVYAFEFRPSWTRFSSAVEGLSPTQVELVPEMMDREQAEARETAEDLLEQLVHDVGPGTVPVATVALQDRHPAEALVQQSSDADMLVVGSRGRGGFTGLLLGSVSQHCIHHANVPVVVVRGTP